MTTDSTTPAAPALPERWSLEFRSAANIWTVTLADETGEQREIGFSNTQPAAGYLLAQSLDEIDDPQLREAAEKVLRTHYSRVATAQANADSFADRLPRSLREDLDSLLGRLLDCRSTLTVDPDTLAPTLALAGHGPASGTLLTQLRLWQQQDAVPDEELRLDLDEAPGTLTATLTGERAADFLTWLHHRYVAAAAPADNDQRADRAHLALAAYHRAAADMPTVPLDPDRDSVADLIAALLHLGRRHGLNYEDLHSHGRGLYERQEDEQYTDDEEASQE